MKKILILSGFILNFAIMAGGYYLYYNTDPDERIYFQPETREIIQQCEGISEDYTENIFLWQSHIIKTNKCLLKAINNQLDNVFDNSAVKHKIVNSIAKYDILSLNLADKAINYNKYCYLNCGSINERLIPYSAESLQLERLLDFIVIEKKCQGKHPRV